MYGAETVRTRVPTSYDHNIFILGGDEIIWCDGVAFATAILLCQVVHREVDTRQFASGYAKVPGTTCTSSQKHRVMLVFDLLCGHVTTDVHLCAEPDAFFLHDRDTAREKPFLHLEFGDAVAQQPPDSV